MPPQAFEHAMAEVDFRVRQIAWDFTQEKDDTSHSGSRHDSESERRRSRLYRSQSSSWRLAGSGAKGGELPSSDVETGGTVAQGPGQAPIQGEEPPLLSPGDEEGSGEAGEASQSKPPNARTSPCPPSRSPRPSVQPPAQPHDAGTAETSPRGSAVPEGEQAAQASAHLEAPEPSPLPSLPLTDSPNHPWGEQSPPDAPDLARPLSVNLPSPRTASQADGPQHPRSPQRLPPMAKTAIATQVQVAEPMPPPGSARLTTPRRQLSLREGPGLPSPRPLSSPRRVAPDPESSEPGAASTGTAFSF